MNGRRDWGDEAGFGLIEVMVSAVVVVLIATATVSAIGASQKQSGRTLARGVTANLAEQDQERMKAMRTSDLVGYTATRAVPQENSTYTVESKANLVQGDDNQEVSCTSTGEQSSFLKLTTTVTPPAATDGDPLTVSTLHSLPVAQYSPTSGTLIVRLVKADGLAPQPNIPVTLSGPEARSASTNAAGCAIFQFLTPGSYSAVINSNGYVEETLSQNRAISANVNPGQISNTTIQRYDRAGAITPIRFNGNLTGTATGVTISNGGIPNPSTRTFAAAATTSATGLFPFPGSPYKAWAGRCALNSPETWEPNFYTTNAAQYGPVTVPTGGTIGANVREPPLTLRITLQRAASTTFNSPLVVIRQIDTGCNTAQHFYDNQTFTIPAGSPATAAGTFPASLAANFTLNLPYGRYWACASVNKTGGTGTNGIFAAATTATSAATSVQNTTFTGPASVTTLAINSTSTANGSQNPCITGANNRWGAAGPTALAAP